MWDVEFRQTITADNEELIIPSPHYQQGHSGAKRGTIALLITTLVQMFGPIQPRTVNTSLFSQAMDVSSTRTSISSLYDPLADDTLDSSVIPSINNGIHWKGEIVLKHKLGGKQINQKPLTLRQALAVEEEIYARLMQEQDEVRQLEADYWQSTTMFTD